MKRTRAQRSLDFRKRTKRGELAKRPGRKPDRNRRDPLHRTRPAVSAQHPVHVVLRIAPELGTLRRRRTYHAIRQALGHSADTRADCRFVHVSLQSNHVHLLVEADSKRALARGMQGFAISAARRLNRAAERKRGRVWAFRYHATAITSPTQARNALAYILNNWRHHRADVGAPWRVDPFSSAWAFFGTATPREPLVVVAPTTWLLEQGWKRAGPIRIDEVPGPDPAVNARTTHARRAPAGSAAA